MADGETKVEGGEQTNPGGIGKVNLSALKRGRGRPAGSKNKTAIDGQKSQPSPTADPNGDATFFAENIVMLYELGDEAIQTSVMRRIAKALPEKTAEFAKLQEEVRLGTRDKMLIKGAAHKLALKYTILQRLGPELMLGFVTIQYGLRQMRLVRFVEAQCAAIEKAKKEPSTAEKN